jgi:ABC-type multidrug transport system ATPase subunit
MKIQLARLQKDFKNFSLGPLDFAFDGKCCIALFGPNGSGKSTLFQLMTGNMDASSGQVLVDEQPFLPDHFATKRRIGYLPQGLELPQWVTPEEILRYAIQLHQLTNPDQLLQECLNFWDLNSFRGRPVAACSYGMQKRVGLAVATLHNPELLILDEPFSGLDILHLRSLFQFLSGRRDSDRLTIISTHGTAYVNRLCERALLMINGQLSEVVGWRDWSNDQKEDEIEKRFN